MATEPLDTELAGTCVGPDGSAIGMPQLCFDWWGNQIFWLVLALIAIYLILSRVALPRIGAVLAERAGTITNDIAAAEDLKAKAIEAEAAYDKALADARSEAQRHSIDTVGILILVLIRAIFNINFVWIMILLSGIWGYPLNRDLTVLRHIYVRTIIRAC